jgi:hypothetical protein
MRGRRRIPCSSGRSASTSSSEHHRSRSSYCRWRLPRRFPPPDSDLQPRASMSTPNFRAAARIRRQAASRSLSLTPCTWLKRATAFRTCSASPIGSFSCDGNANGSCFSLVAIALLSESASFGAVLSLARPDGSNRVGITRLPRGDASSLPRKSGWTRRPGSAGADRVVSASMTACCRSKRSPSSARPCWPRGRRRVPCGPRNRPELPMTKQADFSHEEWTQVLDGRRAPACS